MFGEGGIRELLPELLPIAINARLVRGNTGQQADTGRIAERCRAVCLGKGNPTLGKTVDVGRLRIWMATQVPDPTAQVVNRDEQNVGRLVGMSSRNRRDQGAGADSGDSLHFIGL